MTMGLTPQDWLVWQKLPAANSWLWLRDPESAELSLGCPSPWAELGGPAAARPPLPTHVVYRCLRESWALLCLIPRPCLKQPRQPHHNTFKIAVRYQPLSWKKHLWLGQKASSLGVPGTWLGMVLSSLWKRHRIWLATGAIGPSNVFSKIFFS